MDKILEKLSTKTRNALKKYHPGGDLPSLTILDLLRTPGIGPGAIRELASAVEKCCCGR